MTNDRLHARCQRWQRRPNAASRYDRYRQYERKSSIRLASAAKLAVVVACDLPRQCET